MSSTACEILPFFQTSSLAQGSEPRSLWKRLEDFTSELYFNKEIPLIGNTPFELRYNLNTAKIQGAMAFTDGAIDFIPFVDIKPYESFGLYDSSNSGLGWSQSIGGLTRDIAVTISSFGLYSSAAGANATFGRTAFAAEFAPTPAGLMLSGEGGISTWSVITNYLFKWGGRISTGTSINENLNGEPGG